MKEENYKLVKLMSITNKNVLQERSAIRKLITPQKAIYYDQSWSQIFRKALGSGEHITEDGWITGDVFHVSFHTHWC